MAVKRQVNKIDLENTFRVIVKIATLSSIAALIQLFVFATFHQNALLLELIGLYGVYNYQYNILGINLVRVQAFFYEPKSLAAFLGIAIPVALHLKNKRKAFLFTLVGF